MYDDEKEKIKQQLTNIKSFALTTDIWSSPSNHSYTGLTLHYITDDYELESKVLETKEFSESHTGSHIADELVGILSDWKLVPSMLSAITTDNGSKYCTCYQYSRVAQAKSYITVGCRSSHSSSSTISCSWLF